MIDVVLLTTAQKMCESYADHADRCRVCTVNWQNLKAAVARAEAENDSWTNIADGMPVVGEDITLMLECGSVLEHVLLQADGEWAWRGFFIAPDVAEYWKKSSR